MYTASQLLLPEHETSHVNQPQVIINTQCVHNLQLMDTLFCSLFLLSEVWEINTLWPCWGRTLYCIKGRGFIRVFDYLTTTLITSSLYSYLTSPFLHSIFSSNVWTGKTRVGTLTSIPTEPSAFMRLGRIIWRKNCH